MKKIALLLSVVGMFTFQVARADQTVYGFQDGKFYDINQQLKFFCFADGSCFDIHGTPVVITIAHPPLPTPSVVTTPVPAPATPKDIPAPSVSPTPPTPLQVTLFEYESAYFDDKTCGNCIGIGTNLPTIATLTYLDSEDGPVQDAFNNSNVGANILPVIIAEGRTPNNPEVSTQQDVLGTEHTFLFQNASLKPGHSYFFSVTVTDGSGNSITKEFSLGQQFKMK